MTTDHSTLICSGCGKEASPLDMGRYGIVCFECVKARQRSAVKGRCVCGTKRRPRQVITANRRITSCDRCLCTIVNRSAS